MALAKRSRGGMTGWVAAGLLALGLFAALGNSQETGAESGAEDTAVEVSLQD